MALKRSSQKEILDKTTISISSLNDLKEFNKSSRTYVKFNCQKCGKETAQMVVNLKQKKQLFCQICDCKSTKKKIYGNENYNNTEQNKITCIKNYGVDNPLKVPKIREQINNTCMNKYGQKWHINSKNFQHKANKSYKYDNQNFDSSYELAYYIWLKDTNAIFEYHPGKYPEQYLGNDNVLHDYLPDFWVDGQYQEIKGQQFFNKKGEPYSMYTKSFWWEKYNFLIKNHVKIIKFEELSIIFKYIENKYGKHYLSKFKN